MSAAAARTAAATARVRVTFFMVAGQTPARTWGNRAVGVIYARVRFTISYAYTGPHKELASKISDK